MKSASAVALLATSALLCSCAIPSTPLAFEQSVKHSATFGRTKSLVVHRSLAAVTATFRRQSQRCLNKTIIVETRGPLGGGIIGTVANKIAYYATVTTSPGKVQLAVESRDLTPGTFYAGGPKRGPYAIVANGTAVNRYSTRVNLYYIYATSSSLVSAVTDWARGSDFGCPVLAN